VTGDELTRTILEAAAVTGWRATHFRPARTSRGWRTPLSGDTGFPDLVLARRAIVLAPEVKGDGDRLRPEQRAWLDSLGAGAPATALAGVVGTRQLDAILRFLVSAASAADVQELGAALAAGLAAPVGGRSRG
jgi:hypothetical protein